MRGFLLGKFPVDSGFIGDYFSRSIYFLTSKIKGALAVAAMPIVRVGHEPECEKMFIGAEGFVLKPGGLILGFTRERVSLEGKYVCFPGKHGSCAQA